MTTSTKTKYSLFYHESKDARDAATNRRGLALAVQMFLDTTPS